MFHFKARENEYKKIARAIVNKQIEQQKNTKQIKQKQPARGSGKKSKNFAIYFLQSKERNDVGRKRKAKRKYIIEEQGNTKTKQKEEKKRQQQHVTARRQDRTTTQYESKKEKKLLNLKAHSHYYNRCCVCVCVGM